MVKRTLVLAVGSAAIVAAGLAGCSSDKSASDQAKDAMSSVTSAVTSATDAVKGNPEPGHAKMTVDGEEQDISGVAVCTPTGADMTIAIAGEDGGVSVVVAEDASKVTSVGLGTVDGVGLSVSPAGGDATASKDGKTYKVKGNAIGADLANPMAPVNKAFELAITCP
ncbi:lipoprotein LpqH [Mycolicibacterium fallax]|nr:lipoprotein LpqH [Mycolicibacterium fallax]